MRFITLLEWVVLELGMGYFLAYGLEIDTYTQYLICVIVGLIIYKTIEIYLESNKV
jgi:hypothetical protein